MFAATVNLLTCLAMLAHSLIGCCAHHLHSAGEPQSGCHTGAESHAARHGAESTDRCATGPDRDADEHQPGAPLDDCHGVPCSFVGSTKVDVSAAGFSTYRFAAVDATASSSSRHSCGRTTRERDPASAPPTLPRRELIQVWLL